MRLALALLILFAASEAHAQDLPVAQVNWRYEEDWSTLRDHVVKDAPWWLPAKYQPLTADGKVWVSFGLEARVRYEGFQGNEWGSADAPDDGYLWLRAMPHADLHAGPVRVFVQGIAGYAAGVAGGAGPVDETGLDLLQGFADVTLPLGKRGSLMVRGGRELVALGSERLIGIRYGPNILQAFDGWRATATLHGVKVNLMRLRPVAIGPSDFDDATDKTRLLTAAYATVPLGLGTDAAFDLYYLDYHRDLGTFVQGSAEEDRHTLGVRFFGTAGDWSWNWEAILQRGRFGDGPIRAWSIASETSRAFPHAPLSPTLRLRANAVSGDHDPADPKLGTFNPLFPKGKYFGELSPIGPYNIVNVHPDVDLHLGRGFSFNIAAVAYWRQSRGDGVYDMPGQIIREGSGSGAHYIGTQGEAVLSWEPNAALSMLASYSIFEPGRFIEETGPARTIHMVGLETMYRF